MQKRESVFGYPKTIGERVYLYLKDQILKGEIRANERIQEKEISSLFMVSSTPVREAVLRLAGEGLIKITSHKEAVVKSISYKELIEIYQVMDGMDKMALELAFDRMSEEGIKVLEEMEVKMEKYCKKETVEKYLELNEAIWLKISELSGNSFLYQVRQHTHSQLARYRPLRFFLFTASGMLERVLERERMVFEALKRRDRKKMKEAMRQSWIEFLPSEAEWEQHEKKQR